VEDLWRKIRTLVLGFLRVFLRWREVSFSLAMVWLGSSILMRNL